jgi:hypothetical protein
MFCRTAFIAQATPNPPQTFPSFNTFLNFMLAVAARLTATTAPTIPFTIKLLFNMASKIYKDFKALTVYNSCLQQHFNWNISGNYCESSANAAKHAK